MYVLMPNQAKGERLPLRIDKDLKDDANAVARLRGHGSLSDLVRTLLKEAINKEKRERPDFLKEEIEKLKLPEEVKRPVPVRSPANITERKHDRKASTPLKRARKR